MWAQVRAAHAAEGKLGHDRGRDSRTDILNDELSALVLEDGTGDGDDGGGAYRDPLGAILVI